MTEKEKIDELIAKRLHTNVDNLPLLMEYDRLNAMFNEFLEWQKQQNIYVVTRCEEHDDYVEAAFKSRDKAESYCGQFVYHDDYSRHITSINLR